jgi:hypothetical protein
MISSSQCAVINAKTLTGKAKVICGRRFSAILHAPNATGASLR